MNENPAQNRRCSVEMQIEIHHFNNMYPDSLMLTQVFLKVNFRQLAFNLVDSQISEISSTRNLSIWSL